MKQSGIEFMLDLFDATRNHIDFSEVCVPESLSEYVKSLYEKYSQDVSKVSCDCELIHSFNPRKNSAVFTITGGKDSIATFLKSRNKFNSYRCFYVKGITPYVKERELESARIIADMLDFELETIDLGFDYTTSLVESVIKNQMIYALVLDNLGYTPSHIGFGGTKELGPQSMCFYHDSTDAFEKFSVFARSAWGEHTVMEFQKDEIESYRIIYENAPQIISHLSSCMTPEDKKNKIRKEVTQRFGLFLENEYQCGACYKCAEEQIIAKEFFGRKISEDYANFCRTVLIDKCTKESHNMNGLVPKEYLSKLNIKI